LAIFEGLTPALKAARTALNFPGVNETDAASTGRLLGVFACEGGFLPRRCCSAVTTVSNCSSSWSLRCLIAAGKSLGKTCRGDEAALSAVGVGGLGGSKDGSRGNTVEKRSGIIGSLRPLPIRRSCRYLTIVAMDYGCPQDRYWVGVNANAPQTAQSRGNLNVGAFVGCWIYSRTREACAIAFSKLKDNLIKSALSPLLRLRQPQLSMFWI